MSKNELLTFGWREWVRLPDLDLPAIKAKVDTGARTSAIHAFDVRLVEGPGRDQVEFLMHPNQRDTDTVVACCADVIDQRDVTDSGGHREKRWVIETMMEMGGYGWPIELTLTARDDMRFRMLLGRTALKNMALVDSSRSYLVGKKPKKKKPRREKD